LSASAVRLKCRKRTKKKCHEQQEGEAWAAATVLNIQDVLVELRSEKFKAYQRLAPAAAGS
jgi:hypothetical protein